MTTIEDILSDVVIFLKETLASEELSTNANQRRLALLQKITSRDSIAFSYLDMNGSHKSVSEVDSPGECYEELESSWSGSGGSSNISRSYSNTLPAANKHQRFSFFFVNGLCESKNKEFVKNVSDSGNFSHDDSKRNSVLSDSDNSLSPSSVKSEDSLEIMSISASAIKYSAVKCGPLLKKEKVLFVEHTKRYWAALLGTNLYIYTNEKDTKPINCISVDEYNARPIAVSQNNKKEFGFEIVCPGKKTYQFYSTLHSEMETWVMSINHSLPLPQISSVSSTSTPNILQCSDQESKVPEFKGKQRPNSCRYESEKPTDRELPSIPVLMHYDTPNPACRSVTPNEKFNRLSTDSLDGIFPETYYQSIDESSIAEQLARYDYPVRNDPVYKNKENYYQEDNLYYNILDHIQQKDKSENGTLKKDSHIKSSLHKNEERENVCHKNGISRIRQIIQKMEEINNQNSTFTKKTHPSNDTKLFHTPATHPTAISEEIYELVNSPTYVNINA